MEGPTRVSRRDECSRLTDLPLQVVWPPLPCLAGSQNVRGFESSWARWRAGDACAASNERTTSSIDVYVSA
jgi:hypothetical protein